MKVQFLKRRPPRRDWPMIAASLSIREQHQHMQRVLQREHARAERHGKPFTLVVLHIDRLAAHRAVRRLYQAIQQRIRLTDEIGWLDNDRLAILLPETSDAGAQQLVAHLKQMPQFSAVGPKLTVHVYPPAPSEVQPVKTHRRIETPLELPVHLDAPVAPNVEAAWQQ